MNDRTAVYIVMVWVLLVGFVWVRLKDRIASALPIDTPVAHVVVGATLLVAGIVWGIIYHTRTPKGFRHFKAPFDGPFGLKGHIRVTNPGIIVAGFGAIVLIIGLLAK